MKLTTLTNLLLLTSMTLFTACSNKDAKVKEANSIYNTIGLDNSKRVNISSNIESLPLAQTYPMPVNYNALSNISSNRTHVASNSYSSYRSRNRYQPYQPVMQEIRRENNSMLSKRIEWDAKKLLGLKYVWGATGPKTYDCSGFTQKIFRDAGIKIPRVSRDQAKVGKYVRYSNLIKGDLVFFDTHSPRRGTVTHVGIYLGNGNFIHASSGAKKIVVFNFNKKKFYKKRFLWGRRVIKNNTYVASL